MRNLYWPAALLGACIVFAGTARSDEPSTARRVIDEAIEAIGGETRLAKFNAATWKSKGVFRIGKTAREFTSEWAIQGSHQYRKVKAYPGEGAASDSILVLNGNEAWFWSQRGLFSFKDRQLEPARAEHYTHWVALRLDIKSTARLSLLDETHVDDRPTVGVKVRDTDVPEVDLYFDKSTKLLARMDTHFTNALGEKTTETRVFRRYKEAGNIKYASVVHWTGKSGAELATQEEERWDFAVHERLNESLFAKPDEK